MDFSQCMPNPDFELTASATVGRRAVASGIVERAVPSGIVGRRAMVSAIVERRAIASGTVRRRALASGTVRPRAIPTNVSVGASSATGPGTTLQSGYLWIRAVEAPNFHKYLQSKPLYSPGVAILDTYTSAGQFQIVSGQLVQLINSTYSLYANVQQNTTAAVKLSVSFNTTKNAYGTFVFSGDAVTWSTPDIKRPNLSAWLTPAGCADETIHFYNDKTAVS
ncbi:hypothetical protein EG329_003866 [Mollisiaceae sp. DMI_Dod_QoI]|nr:hypothetical protein EG329_003866 [Helotiales sp. DMI_Dod_QoI]